jgi:protocatechuate 3,4-dioxygenase, beta subunit
MTDLSNKKPETGAFFPRDRDWHPPAYTPTYKTSVLRSPQKALLSLDGTKSEITGPVFGHSMLGELDNDLIHNFAKPGESAIGERIIVHGRVLDERGRPVPGALIEFWQANAGGRYRHKKESYLAPLDPNFGGCGRTMTRTAIMPSARSSPVLIPGRMVSTTGGRRISISPSLAMASRSV